MIGKIINYGTDNLLPDRYKFVGDYTCAIVDGATGDFASAGVLTAEGVSENLRQLGNEDAALVADVTGAAASVASGDINTAVKNGSNDALKNAGLKMGAVGTSAGIGKLLDDNKGARIATSIATGSMGKDLNETAIKSGLNATGVAVGYKAKGKDGILNGATLANNSFTMGTDIKDTLNKDQLDLQDVKRLKQDSIAAVKSAKELTEDKPNTKDKFREKVLKDQQLELLNKSTDAAFTSAKLINLDKDNSAEIKTDEETANLISEVGMSGNAICRIKEKKIEGEGKEYKITDTLCYISGNYKEIKDEINSREKRK